MQANFPPDVVTVLDSAHCKAVQDEIRDIGLFHILGALLECEDQVIQGNLLVLGIDRERAAIEVAKAYAHFGAFGAPGSEFSRGAKRALEMSAARAAAESREVSVLDLLHSVLSLGSASHVMNKLLGLRPGAKIDLESL